MVGNPCKVVLFFLHRHLTKGFLALARLFHATLQSIKNTYTTVSLCSFVQTKELNETANILSFLLPLFHEGQLSVTGESMCTKYWLTA